ncbi:MAG: hypothetical protein Satyrvirus24_19 [Satyrvirus sp.]|uniref:Uncharacterized protein n=1 Tax=Satyrvirus sp. TaxID=2487771 RepID=A0A3G5AEE5_9VIRU|nr:MAG: hypothetical protein Satyrvirus24_19 [Satyrvirus sp.]
MKCSNCSKVLQKICDELRNKNSLLSQEITKVMKKNPNGYAMKDRALPKYIRQDFEILRQCQWGFRAELTIPETSDALQEAYGSKDLKISTGHGSVVDPFDLIPISGMYLNMTTEYLLYNNQYKFLEKLSNLEKKSIFKFFRKFCDY